MRPLLPCGLTVCLIASLAACVAENERTSSAPDSAALVRTGIARAWADHIAAAKRKDPVAVSSIYSMDAVYAVAGAPEVRGRQALEIMEARGLDAAEVIDATQSTHGLRVVGDIAYELGSIVGPVQPKGDTVRVVNFNYMATWRREPDGRWLLAYLVGR